MTEKLVLYHGNCADGYGAAFAAWLRFGDEATYIPMQYLKDWQGPEDFYEIVSPDLVLGSSVFILDFSLPKSVMETVFHHAGRTVWLDHHKTAFESHCGTYEPGMLHVEQDDKVQIVLDDNKSGAMLAWDHFHDCYPPVLYQHLDQYDRGGTFKGWAMPGTKEFHLALRSYAPWSFPQWEQFLAFSDSVEYHQPYQTFLSEGAAILRAHEQVVNSVYASVAPCRIVAHDVYAMRPGYLEGLMVNAQRGLASDLGHMMATNCGTYGLVWNMGPYGEVRCSFRSNGDYDVSAIAKAFGGGGHRNAAGCQISVNTLIRWLGE